VIQICLSRKLNPNTVKLKDSVLYQCFNSCHTTNTVKVAYVFCHVMLNINDQMPACSKTFSRFTKIIKNI
jgi:hypothetical protein